MADEAHPGAGVPDEAASGSPLLLIIVVCIAVYHLFKRMSAGHEPETVGTRQRASTSPAGQTRASPGQRDDRSVLILYGTQSGTAQEYAFRLAHDAKRFGLRPDTVDMEEYDTNQLADERLVLVVTSTYGEGDPPDNAKQVFAWLEDQVSAPCDQLAGIRYAVFALGDETYGDDFCKAGKTVAQAFQVLGAKEIVPIGLGNDNEVQEDDFNTWRDAMWPVVCSAVGIDISEAADEVATQMYALTVHDAGTRARPPFPRLHRSVVPTIRIPATCTVVENTSLHTSLSERDCRHIVIDLEGTGCRYETGDHLGVFAANPAAAVEALAARLSADLDQIVTLTATDPTLPMSKKHPFPCPASVRQILSWYLDIQGPIRKGVVKALSQYTTDASEAERLAQLCDRSDQSKAAWHAYAVDADRTLLEVLQDFPSLQPPLDHVLELLPRLQPRYYSISSSPNHPSNQDHKVTITVAITRWRTKTGRDAEGVCSGYLLRLAPGDPVVVFVRPSTFRAPRDPSAPLVMVGPGTGLAPFRGFLQDRHVVAEAAGDASVLGPAHLFFGCRREDHDFIYESELRAAVLCKSLHQLHTAFSRQGPSKVYVQHRLKENSQQVWAMLSQSDTAHFYICGDGKAMARDVLATLALIVQEHGGKDEAAAAQFIDDLRKSGRLQQDVW